MRILLRLAVVLTTIFFGLLFAELGLRFFDLAPVSGVATVTDKEFHELPGIFSPGQDLVDLRNPRLPHRVRTSSLGFRGPEATDDRSAVSYRLLVLGDSFTYGDFVDDEETLPARLEARLSERCSSGEVINAGVPGSGIVTQAAMLDRGLGLEPDHVILVFSDNDITDLIPPTPWERLAANRRAKSRFPLSLVYPVVRRTALWNLGLQARAQARTRQGPQRAEAAHAGAAPVPRRPPHAGEALTSGGSGRHAALREEYLERLHDLFERVAQLGVPFHFVVYPSHHSVSGPPLSDEVWVTEQARRIGIPTVDLLPDLEDSGLPVDSLYLLPHDGHPSPTGYAVAARALETRLVQDGFLKNCEETSLIGN